MNKQFTRRIIALGLAFAYIIFIGYGMYANISVPAGFEMMVASVIGYYFGKSTALDKAK